MDAVEDALGVDTVRLRSAAVLFSSVFSGGWLSTDDAEDRNCLPEIKRTFVV